MDLERVLYKKMTKDELIDKLIAYKNIECHDRAIAHEFLCMQKEDPSRMNFVTHRLTDIADPKRVAEEIRRVKAERTASAQQPIKDELTDTIPVYVTLYKNIRFKKRFDVTLDQLERFKEEDSAESKEVPITLLDETLNLIVLCLIWGMDSAQAAPYPAGSLIYMDAKEPMQPRIGHRCRPDLKRRQPVYAAYKSNVCRHWS